MKRFKPILVPVKVEYINYKRQKVVVPKNVAFCDKCGNPIDRWSNRSFCQFCGRSLDWSECHNGTTLKEKYIKEAYNRI